MIRYHSISLLILLSIVLSVDGNAQSSLKDVFAKQFLVGAAVNDDIVTGRDAKGAAIAAAQFNTITAENVMKWENIHPRPGVYDFSRADVFVAFGQKNGMALIGHTLVWHNQTPAWVFQDSLGRPASKEMLLERMRDHIMTVMGRYKGKMKGWDVVNEALVDDGSYKDSPWYRIIGEEYLVKAYQFAHEADPAAELYYNDFSVENVPKREGVVRLVSMLKKQGAVVNGIGMQGHYIMDWPSAGMLDSTIRAFGALGVAVMVTELDVDILPRPEKAVSAEITRTFEYKRQFDPFTAGLPAEKQAALAARYEELFRVFVRNSAVLGRVTFWGVHDGSSWLNGFPVPNRTNHPLLFDRQGEPKPAYTAVLRAGGVTLNQP